MFGPRATPTTSQRRGTLPESGPEGVEHVERAARRDNPGGHVRRRSNLLVLLGVAFFIVGSLSVYLVINDDDDGSSSSTEPGKVTVVVAKEDIPLGSLADELISSGKLAETEILAAELTPGAILSLTQLAGAEFIQPFAASQQITTAGLQLENRTFEIPAGYEAIAVQIDFVPGGAGYVNAGDRINLYGVFGAAAGNANTPRAELLLTNVEVLDVDLSIPPRRGSGSSDPSQPATQRATGSTVTYLLALRTNDAEKIIFTTEFHSFYASLTAKDAPPAGPTGGRDPQNVLDEEPNVAFNR